MATFTVTSGLSPAFVSGDTVTPAKLNSLGTPTIAISAIQTADISDAQITSDKLATGAVTADKVATGAVTGAPGGGKLAASAITGQTQLTDTLADGDEFLVHDTSASALRRVAYSSVKPLTFSTAQASTSGTSIDFTGIPSWVKRITVMLSGVSTNGTSTRQLQLGDSGGFETTNYTGGVMEFNDNATLSSGFPLNVPAGNTAAETLHGFVVLSNVTGNTWVANGTIHATARAVPSACAGSKTLSDVLDRVRITTVNGTDTFDAGTINISYE